MTSDTGVRVRPRFQPAGDGPAIVHVCVYENHEMEKASSPNTCGYFQTQHQAHQAANLLEGLHHNDAAQQIRELSEMLPEE